MDLLLSYIIASYIFGFIYMWKSDFTFYKFIFSPITVVLELISQY